MAYVSSSRTAVPGLGDRIVALYKVVGQSMQRRRAYLQTLDELKSLSDRDLADVGVERDQIPQVARGAAYGI